MADVGVGALEGVEWNVRVGLSSSEIRSLPAQTLVQLMLLVRSESKALHRHNAELSLPEFNALLAGLKQAQQAMNKL